MKKEMSKIWTLEVQIKENVWTGELLQNHGIFIGDTKTAIARLKERAAFAKKRFRLLQVKTEIIAYSDEI